MSGTGLLIALEGIDGSGTTTQTGLLVDALTKRGFSIHRTAEPSTGPVGILIRQALQRGSALSHETLGLLFAADRLDHVQREIAPALAAGKIVLSDRYLLSSLAYQSLHLPLPWVVEINARAMRPHLSILLDVQPGVAKSRRIARGHAAERFDDDDIQERVAKAYRDVFALADMGETHVMTTHDDIPVVHRALVDYLLPWLDAHKTARG